MPCRQGLKYTDYTPPAKEQDPTQKGCPGMTLNCILWQGYVSGDLESMEYTFIAITPRPTLTQSDSIC